MKTCQSSPLTLKHPDFPGVCTCSWIYEPFESPFHTSLRTLHLVFVAPKTQADNCMCAFLLPIQKETPESSCARPSFLKNPDGPRHVRLASKSKPLTPRWVYGKKSIKRLYLSNSFPIIEGQSLLPKVRYAKSDEVLVFGAPRTAEDWLICSPLPFSKFEMGFGMALRRLEKELSHHLMFVARSAALKYLYTKPLCLNSSSLSSSQTVLPEKTATPALHGVFPAVFHKT